MNEKYRILIISNECLSTSSSNGRTLRNFLLGWPKECIAQFFLKSAEPDYDVCENYFHITDKQAIRAFLGKKSEIIVGEKVVSHSKDDLSGSTPSKRNALTMFIRDVIWESGRWKGKVFNQWLDEYNPELILLQAGDNGFTLKLARDISIKRNIPLVIYNSENFYFKKYDYFRSSVVQHLFYPVYRKHFCHQFEKTIKIANKSIYICDMLQNDYDQAFGYPSETIYTATEMTKRKDSDSKQKFTVSYLGNFGVGRYETLVEIADVLQTISSDCFLDVYGKIPNDIVREAFDKCTGIRYKGFVSYEECVHIMHHSDLLIHAENFSPFFREGLKRAFSTKLADSLASGTCFLLYAPEEIACSQYLIKNNAAYVATSKKELRDTLKLLYEHPGARQVHIDEACKLIAHNHDADKNSKRFQRILIDEAQNGKRGTDI